MALDIAKLEEEIKEEQQQTEDKPPKAMEELYNLLQQLGSAWREDNAYIVNEGQKNERTVIPLPNVSTVANVLENHTIHEYIDKRTEQLKEQATFEELVDKVALYESELLDYAERLLSDDPLIADSETAIGTLDMLDDEAIDLFKSVDIDNEYQGLEYYNTSLNKED